MTPDHTHEPEDCRALNEVLARIGDRWFVQVVGLLGKGPMRFNQIRRTIGGVSQRMLTHVLRSLERDGLVTRTQYPTIPPRVDYALTARGRSLLDPISALAGWAREHRVAIEESRTQFDRETEDDEPMDRLRAVGGW